MLFAGFRGFNSRRDEREAMPKLKSSWKTIGRNWGFFLLIGFLLLVVVPVTFSDFRLSLIAKFLTYAIVALGISLIWGYGGMLSLGQGVFFGLGAYCTAMYLKLEDAKNGLPDFMVWSGLSELPWFWEPFRNPVVALLLAILLPMALAALIGLLLFRSRVQGVYFSIITQALALIMVTLLVGQQPVTGGTNGMTNFSTMFGFDLKNQDVQKVFYFITVVCLGGAYLLCRMLVRSRYGNLLVAMREDENRVRFMGYDPVPLKILAFTVSAGLAGLAGALFVPQVGLITPSTLGIVPSIEMVIWVAVGGREFLVGAILGALLVNFGKSSFSETFPEFWQYFYGALFIGVVLLFPRGLVGATLTGITKLQSWWYKRKPERPASVIAESEIAEPIVPEKVA